MGFYTMAMECPHGGIQILNFTCIWIIRCNVMIVFALSCLFMCDTLPIPMLFPMPTLWEFQIYLHSWYSYTKDCYSSIMSFSTGIGRFPCVVWLNFASLSHRILVQLQVFLILLQFTFSSHCTVVWYPISFLRICAFKRCDVSSIDSYSINDLYTFEVTWTFVVCHLLAFDIFNYYHSVNVVNFTLGSSK